jgi:sulfur-oxidizing protein SoxZ
MAKPLINVPKSAKRGEVIEIKTLIAHVMETGFRHDTNGRVFPRDIINRLVVTYSGEVIFAADLFPAIAANPFVAFTTMATDSGDITFRWTDDKGAVTTETVSITVT